MSHPKLTDIAYLRGLLDRHGFAFSKKLGQNFLVNPSVCPRMAEACGAAADTGVLEIGPGVGVLTRELASRAGKVAAIELDRRLLPVLDETLAGQGNVEIIQGDALKLDLRRIIAERFPGMPVSVCANLPYYITSPLIMALLEQRLPVRSITVMVQKEAADRLCAAPGTRACGAVSLAVSYFSEPEILFSVSRGSFLPAPAVDSSVIRLTVKPPRAEEAAANAAADERRLFALIRAGFNQRRKTLVNAAAAGGFDKQRLAEVLAAQDLPVNIRAEALTLEQFIAAANDTNSF
ncbi:MAG: 16S rRNA (adenine(1518)-N(6)/adenine(1519)-N(6))-dimethyltransferase RsmA [Oscillospiraceae bacterium]|nr:16S rRNA (adenine(1518)-N(6)/adenine(1519)-N(6))-dimethyltransferase RsmA [Oscillospiraceae bacterium]